MKMTPLILRVLSVWLCAAVVCWYSECYVGCTESQQEAEGPVSSQDIRLQEDSDEEILDHKSEESRVLPSQPQSESDQLIQAEYQKPQEVEEKQYPEASEAAEPATETDLVASKGISQPESEHGQSSENQHPEVLNSQNQDLASILPSPDPLSGSAAGLEDSPNVPNVQDNIPKSASDDAFEVLDSDGPPVDCQEETNLYESDSPPTVLENTANVHTTGTNTQTDPPVSSPPVSSPPDHSTQQLEANVSHILKDQDLSSPVTAEADFNVSVKDPEDIPTFDEWKRKVMEVEKEKTQSVHTSTNGVAHAVKKIQKNFNNYASVECGAKILGANPEAKSTSAILKENMDVYMLNPCSNKIWFIIELCEPIQLKQLDIANFELFSSTPKDFLVSISDRYPTNKWLKLGTFHARDERIVQSFPLDEHLYAKYVKMFTKYIKVELLSNFGSEHFCPLSLIRVFGTSMVEEYEEIADPPERSDDQDDDLDYPPGYASGEDKLSNNLIGSAKDVILNMVNNIAVNVLGGGSDMQGNLSSPEVNITEPSPQPETTTETAPTDVSSAPDPEEEEIQQDTDIPATVAPSSETPVPETTTSETSEPEPPPEEEKLVTPLDKDEEEHISSTITLLDKEDDLDEEEERSAHRERQLEIQMCCTLVPLCSCAPSLQEYLHQQCSALLSIKMKCQTMYGKEIISSNQKPSWHQPVPPSGQPESLHPRSEVHQPHEKEQPSEQEPESRVSPAEPPEPSHETEASIKDSMSQPPQLEPSQTSDLPKPGATELSSAKPTAAVETPPLSSAEPGEMQDVAEEKHIEPSPSFSSSIYLEPSASATVEPLEEKSDTGVSQPEINTPIQTSDGTDEAQVLHPTSSRHGEHHLDPSAVPDSGPATTEEAPPIQDDVTELEPTAGFPDNNLEDIAAELPASPTPVVPPSLPSSPSLSDIYADDGTEQNGNLGKNGNLVHSTSQKESVFMRLNNRIKALEMNMSLSGRYLEQLSQRYRKQMEEMQKAFNKTIIKLQNTSRIAEEQDQRQTESIQSLQGQLENMTQLVLNLSVTVSQLQNEVSDRQSYLLLSLVLSLCLGLLLCVNFCRVARIAPRTEPQPPVAKSYTYCSPERQTSSDETGLKRSASFPLINSEPFQLDTAEGKQRSPRGTDMLHPEDKHSLCAATRKRRRRKMKPMEEVETLKPAFHAFSELCNGGSVCNGVPITTSFTPSTKTLLLPMCGNTVSEGSSEGSSHSDDPSFCGITTACTRICEGHPPAMFRAEKQASRRRRPKPTCPVVNLLPAPRRDNHEPLTISSIHDIMNRKTEQSSGTFGTKVALSGPV